MHSWKRILAPVIASLGLFACDRPDAVPTGPDAATGTARVALPALPAGYLAGAEAAWLRLDITGPGMVPIFAAETLYVGQSATLEVKGIPPGTRVFHGTLYRTDSAGGDTAATHEGSVTALIQAGATANVPLFLKSTDSGSAHICLQVEGWPVDSSCAQPPPQPRYPDLAGCYALTVTKPGPRQDSLFKATLRITQYDSSLFAVATWKSGAKDSATGYVLPGGGGFYLGSHPSQFVFKGNLDTGSGGLSGYFQDSARGISGDASAGRVACDTVTPPPPDSVYLDSLLCWNVRQSTVDGRNMTGTLWAGWRGASLRAWFEWNDLSAFRMDNGTIPAGGSSTLYLFGTLPGGFGHPARSALEMGHYKAKLNLGGALQNGAAYARAGTTDFTGADKFADWSGAPMACPDRARSMVTALFR